jgi:hypothetical protein
MTTPRAAGQMVDFISFFIHRSRLNNMPCSLRQAQILIYIDVQQFYRTLDILNGVQRRAKNMFLAFPNKLVFNSLEEVCEEFRMALGQVIAGSTEEVWCA